MKKLLNNLWKVLLALGLILSFMGCSDFFVDKDGYPPLDSSAVNIEDLLAEIGVTNAVPVSIVSEDESIIVFEEKTKTVEDEEVTYWSAQPYKAGDTRALVTTDKGGVYYLHVHVGETGKVTYEIYLTKKITFHSNKTDSDEIEERYFEVNYITPLPRKLFPRGTGWQIMGWSTVSTATIPGYSTSTYDYQMLEGADVLFETTTAIDLYAVWKYSGVMYTITFDANTGTGEMDSMEIIPNEPYVLPANVFKKAGKTFLGWSEDKDAKDKTYSNKETVRFTRNVTLYAVWGALQGEYDVDDFWNTKFIYAKDIDLVSYKKPYQLKTYGNIYDIYDDANEQALTTPVSATLSTNAYIKLEKSSTTTSGIKLEYNGSKKTITTYNIVLYTDGSEKNILAKDAVIVGISEYGVMIDMNGNYGAFLYVNAGYTASSNGSSLFYPDFDTMYPTDAEITAFMAKLNS